MYILITWQFLSPNIFCLFSDCVMENILVFVLRHLNPKFCKTTRSLCKRNITWPSKFIRYPPLGILRCSWFWPRPAFGHSHLSNPLVSAESSFIKNLNNNISQFKPKVDWFYCWAVRFMLWLWWILIGLCFCLIYFCQTPS